MGEYLFDSLRDLTAEIIGPRLDTWGAGQLRSSIDFERPSLPEHGDLSLNIAMAAASSAGRAPRELAVELVEALEQDERFKAICREVSIAGPGFINIFLLDDALSQAVRVALASEGDFGIVRSDEAASILLEFVSANPTGPLHAGHARYAAYGDSLRRILEFTGCIVQTEFYINDFGNQMLLFGRSLTARYSQALGIETEFPEDGYRGEYLVKIAEAIASDDGEKWLPQVKPEPTPEAVAYFSRKGSDMVLADIRSNLERFRVGFDNWFSEASLYQNDSLTGLVQSLSESGETYESEGAIWLRTTSHGDDKDRVLIRSNGEPTYFASDIIYHQEKLAREFDHLINIWGADHHGYVKRVKAAFAVLSEDPDKLEIIIGQLVNILEMGERKQMSKRAGKMVTLEELVDSIGVDAARYFLVDRSHDSTLDLDLAKAKLKTEENPVYYVQYAHARISSIIRKADEEGIPIGSWDAPELEKQERDLVLSLMEFPGIVQAAADSREPHRLTTYARELAATFHVFYHNCPVLKADEATAAFRMDLCRLTRNTIRIVLSLVGVSAPERM